MAAQSEQGEAGTTDPAVDAGTEWFLARDGQQYGPIGDAELARLKGEGQILPTDLLWRDGLDEWQPAAHVLGVQSQPPPSPPPRQQESAQPDRRADTRQRAPHGQERQQQQYVPPSQSPEGSESQPGQGWRSPAYQVPWQDQPTSAQGPQPSPDERSQPQRGAPARTVPVASEFEERGTRERRRPEQQARAPSRKPARQGAGIGVWAGRIGALLFFVLTLGAAGWYAYPHREQISSAVASVIPAREDASVRVPPMTGFNADRALTDEALQKALLWRTLKREFPDWYEKQIATAATLAGEQRSEAEIAAKLFGEIAELRRRNALNALSATQPRIKAIASTLANALTQLAETNVEQCYAVIAAGEAGPKFFEMIQTPALTPLLQGHLVAIFEAIADGRRTPRVWPQPKENDFGSLVSELEALGWSQGDLRLFSDNARLASAPPAQVCRLITQWYQGQLRLKDPDLQLRLIVDALRPLLSG